MFLIIIRYTYKKPLQIFPNKNIEKNLQGPLNGGATLLPLLKRAH
jgi:hypothetical protein